MLKRHARDRQRENNRLRLFYQMSIEIVLNQYPFYEASPFIYGFRSNIKRKQSNRIQFVCATKSVNMFEQE